MRIDELFIHLSVENVYEIIKSSALIVNIGSNAGKCMGSCICSSEEL